MKLLPLYSKCKGNSFETPAMEKRETIWNDFQNGGLKNVDISSKICSLQCFWVKKLYGRKSHDLKLIPMHFINNAFGKNFIFHSNLVSKLLYCISCLLFYANILQSRKRNFSHVSYLLHS